MSDIKEAFKKAGFREAVGQKSAVPDRTPYKAQSQSGTDQTASVHEDYTSKAEQVIQTLSTQMGRDYSNFTTSKIRNILAMVNEIYNDVLTVTDETLSTAVVSRIQYLKVRLVYECGREPKVIKPFVEKAGLLSIINGIGNDRAKFLEFARYMEALVAYHRFHGGRD